MATVAAGAPLLAQPEVDDAPMPRSYPALDSKYAYPGGDPALRTREREAADENAAQCDSGAALSACTALGTAFRTGTGRPQSRPVAELIFRAACVQGEPAACAELGTLLRYAAGEIDTAPHARFIARACELGQLSACTEHARLIEAGVARPADPVAADAIRDSACASGESGACLALIRSLTRAGRPSEDHDRGIALVDRLCEAGNRSACGLGAQLFETASSGDPARVRLFRERGCTAGDTWVCGQLGREALALREGSRATGDATAEALRFLDLACPGLTSACNDAAAIRAQPGLERDCAAGARAACFQLAAAYRESGGALEDLPRAQALLARLCETATGAAQRRESCGPAGEVLFEIAGRGGSADLLRAETLLSRGCDAGDGATCLLLARALAEEGSGLPQDLPRSYALYDAQCAQGSEPACKWLAQNILYDPATPLPMADGDFIPPEDAAGAGRDQQQEGDPELDRCTTTTVDYRGTTYGDTICSSVMGVIKGTPVLAGTAPWQALIWRPARVGNAVIAEGYNVLCGGTVIRTGWVLTAAHCLTDQGRDIATAGHRIRLGVSNPLSGQEGYSYPILRTHKPAQYRGPPWLQFDIALIEYDPRGGQREGFAYEVRRIMMDPKPFAVRSITAGTPARVYGWGSTTVEGSGAPSALLQGKVALRTAQACDVEADFTRSDLLKGSLLCGDAVAGQQACSGDSGGPVILLEPAAPGGKAIPVLIGVVSSGVDCGTGNRPSRYTRLSHRVVQKWLADVLPPASPGARPQARR